MAGYDEIRHFGSLKVFGLIWTQKQKSCQTLRKKVEQETPNKSSEERQHGRMMAGYDEMRHFGHHNESSEEKQYDRHVGLYEIYHRSPFGMFGSSWKQKQKSCQTSRNKVEQETPNKCSTYILQISSQTTTREEQETPNKPCVRGKDFIIKFEKNDVKRRGKIPSWHEKILTKNFLMIMENIRVEKIIDHLFSTEVIDLNEMDEIESKLRSEGNRKVLRIVVHKYSWGFMEELSISNFFSLYDIPLFLIDWCGYMGY
ncbi:hypothetical protein LOTGIDRAFT_163384 [Lottia gigantea]|uniref:CARD domain-containing protein n=1 Tax=Lottia gigantea TaxID=225164 RepID=V4A998_LOTGI|nr:hypothetical protein LOTGIDRAFT_163384 [Lottia gigantea]ESO91655.1 hypothetical protein LOTGIDRAFT_163384 [Lottia gigantea]